MDVAALAKVLEQARLTGDPSAIRAALQQLDTEELPAEPGETRRFRMAGMPPESINIHFDSAASPPPSFPEDLAWLPGAKISVAYLGAGAMQALWAGIDTDSAVTAIVAHAQTHGWRESAAFPYPTASGLKPRYLERDGVTRTIMAVGAGPAGLVQVMQPPRRAGASESGGSAA